MYSKTLNTIFLRPGSINPWTTGLRGGEGRNTLYTSRLVLCMYYIDRLANTPENITIVQKFELQQNTLTPIWFW